MIKPIGRLAVGLGSLAVAGQALALVPKKIKEVNPLKMSKKVVGGFVGIMVGLSLLKPAIGIVKGL